MALSLDMDTKFVESKERSFWSCENCRTGKQACRPTKRKWPDQKCDRCIQKNKPCGPNKSYDGRFQEAQDQQQTCDGSARDKDNDIGEGCSANSQAPSDNVQRQQASPIRQVRQPSQTKKRSLMTEQGCYQNHEDKARSLFERAGIITKALDTVQITQGVNSRSGVQDDQIDWICQLEPKLKEDFNRTMKALEDCAKNAEGDRYICLAELIYVRIQENLSSLDQAWQSEILSSIAAFHKRVGNVLEEEKICGKRSNPDFTMTDHNIQERDKMRLDSHEKISSSISQILGDFVLTETAVNATNPFPISRQRTCNSNSSCVQHVPGILNIPKILRRKWIHVAAEEEFQQTFRQFIDIDPDIDAQDLFGMTALFIAASRGNARYCAALLEKRADVGRRDNDSRTILEVAAKGGFLPVVELLIGYNAEVNATSIRYASTALQAAAQGGHYDVVEYLLHKRANVATKNLDGNTAEDLARQSNHDRVIDLLSQHQGTEEGSNFREAFFFD